MKRILFFSFKSYEEQFFKELQLQDYSFTYIEEKLNQNTVQIAQGYDAVCCFVHDKLDRYVIKKLSEFNINLVALRSAGYNNVDLKAAYEYKVHIVRVPKYSPYAVAEHTVALILALNRKLHKAYVRTRELNFEIDGLLGFDLYKKTAGIIGTGNIGRIVAKILSQGFEMNVLLYDKNPDYDWAASIDAKYVSLEEIYKSSDLISLHCPLTRDTYHILNENSFKMMKDGVMIINTSRGGLIDTKALIDALKNSKVGYAGLDVYEEEEEVFFEDFSSKLLTDDILARLLTFPNVIITSHQAFFTKEALENIAKTTIKNIVDFFENKPLENEICYLCGQSRNSCTKKTTGRCF